MTASSETLHAPSEDTAAFMKSAMTGSVSGGDILGGLLERSSLEPQQTEILKLFLSSGALNGDDDEDDEDDDLMTMPHIDEYWDEPSSDSDEHRPEQIDDTPLQEVNDTLAAALGACHLCWGGDDNCPECDGAGTPGSLPPEQNLFRELILPAVRRFQHDAKNDRGSSTKPNPAKFKRSNSNTNEGE